MAALAVDAQRLFAHAELQKGPRPQVLGSITIFEGSAVGEVVASGFMRALTTADDFRGFASRQVVNAGGNGAERIELYHKGRVRLAVAALVITDIGAAVYATSDNDFLLTEGANPYVGRVVEFVSAGVGWVEFDAARGSLAQFVELTDNSGGTPADTIAVITNAANAGSADVGPTQDAVASLATKMNNLLRMLQ